MKKILVLLSLFFSAGALAGTVSGFAPTNGTAEPTDAPRIPFEFEAEFTYVGDGTIEREQMQMRDFDETYSLVRAIYTPRIALGILRLGGTWERFGFGFQERGQVEDTLQSLSAVVGLDTQFSDSILVRIEAQPGLYGSRDHLDGDTFMIPFIVGGTYIVSSDFQIVLGASVNFDRQFPVFPGGGIRWRFGSQWVLNAVLPTPRIEFEMNQQVMFFIGGNLKGSTFRVDDTFGVREAGDPSLNNAVIDYTEIRVGLGAEIRVSPEFKLTFEGGYLPYREFDYHRTEVRYHHEEGAPYVSVAGRAAF